MTQYLDAKATRDVLMMAGRQKTTDIGREAVVILWVDSGFAHQSTLITNGTSSGKKISQTRGKFFFLYTVSNKPD